MHHYTFNNWLIICASLVELAQQRGEATGTAFAGALNLGGAMRLLGLSVSGIVIIINQGFSLYSAF